MFKIPLSVKVLFWLLVLINTVPAFNAALAWVTFLRLLVGIKN